MVNCPECGKPLKRDTRKAKYFCENDVCSVIFVCHPDKQYIMKIAYKAKARSFESEQIAAT
jgi:NAD-dependent DNA ligase